MSYCEMPIFFSAAWPVARKEHTCCECYGPILKGEKYGSFTGKWHHHADGKVETYKQHLDCEDACRFIRDYMNGGECIGFGELLDCWRDYIYWKRTDLTPKEKDFRSIMARVLWRYNKKRPLTFLKLRVVVNESLEADRKRKWA